MKLSLTVLPFLMAVALLGTATPLSAANTEDEIRDAINKYLTRNVKNIGTRVCYNVLESRFREFHLRNDQRELRAHQDRGIPPANVEGITISSGQADINIDIDFQEAIPRMEHLPARLKHDPTFECKVRFDYGKLAHSEFSAKGHMRCEVLHQTNNRDSELRCEFRVEETSYRS